MKVSELIQQLADLKAKHGDVPVYVKSYRMITDEAENVEFREQCPFAPENILIE